MRKGMIGVAVAAALALSAGTASAFSVGTIVQAAGQGGNNGVQAIYGTALPVSGFFGANWYLVGGTADIKVEFLGREAGWNNSFNFDNQQILNSAEPSGDAFSNTPFASFTALNVGPGLLLFNFGTDGNAGSVFNGANPDNNVNDVTVNWFSRVTTCPIDSSCYGGQSIDLWLDDTGGGPDDNHDDMVIRMSIVGGNGGFAVPIPAALPLLFSGLAGLGFIGRRRRVVPV